MAMAWALPSKERKKACGKSHSAGGSSPVTTWWPSAAIASGERTLRRQHRRGKDRVAHALAPRGIIGMIGSISKSAAYREPVPFGLHGHS